jgi:hypothetical protein
MALPIDFSVMRHILVILIALVSLLGVLVNLGLAGSKNDWGTAFQFSVHAYEQKISTITQFTGPFLSTEHVLPSAHATLTDNTAKTHVDCNNVTFVDAKHIDKCKMMRSPPIYLGDVTNSWSVLGTQSTFLLVKHMLLIFLVFMMFSCSEYALSNVKWNGITDKHVVIVRNAVVFAAVLVFVCELVTDVDQDMSANKAIGSVSTAFSFVVVCLLIICLEYGGMHGKRVELHGDNKDVTLSQMRAEHMHRNIYLSYACLLMLPMASVLVLHFTRVAVVDVHIQLVFFSFIFYATLDVFQTRTTAVLMCMNNYDPAENKDAEGNVKPKLDLYFVTIFVVVAFCLCKWFALTPALVMLHTKYNKKNNFFQVVTISAHYVLMSVFLLADVMHVMWKNATTRPPADLFKLFGMLLYTSLIFFAIMALNN